MEIFWGMLLLCHSPQVIPKPSPHVSPFRRYSIFCVKLCPASGMSYLHRLSTSHLSILQVDTNIITTHLTIHEIFHISFEAVSSIRYVILLGHSFKMTPESSWHASLFTR
ncbi:hypothetical protein BKA83DRAFT_4336067 [Pisolithus microcarpus]|nr:hypothetical protein BKA83DRAFT_4336067 [Pisolithus microcarpus]